MVSQRTKARVLGCMGAVVLTMASTSAFAQSREWQRGYDAGFRDGFAAGQNAGSGGVPPFQPPPGNRPQPGRLVIDAGVTPRELSAVRIYGAALILLVVVAPHLRALTRGDLLHLIPFALVGFVAGQG